MKNGPLVRSAALVRSLTRSAALRSLAHSLVGRCHRTYESRVSRMDLADENASIHPIVSWFMLEFRSDSTHGAEADDGAGAYPFPVFFSQYAYNCTVIDALFRNLTHPLFVSIAFSSIILNGLVILVIRQAMRERETQAQIHLMCLGFSDIAAGLVFVWASIWSWICSFPHCEELACVRHYAVGMAFGYVTLAINKSMTLYIMYVRARAVSTIGNAMSCLNDTMKKSIFKLTVDTAVGAILLAMINFGLSRIFHSFWKTQVFCHSVSTILMALLASFTLVRLKQHRQASPSLATDDFQKLVAIVALFFCASELSSVLLNGVMKPIFGVTTTDRMSLWFFGYFLANLTNSSFNFFVYLFASKRFRAALAQFWVGIKSGTGCT